MDNVTRLLMQGAAGASGDKTYIDDLFSTYLYSGTAGSQSINTGLDIIDIVEDIEQNKDKYLTNRTNFTKLMTPGKNKEDKMSKETFKNIFITLAKEYKDKADAVIKKLKYFISAVTSCFSQHFC